MDVNLNNDRYIYALVSEPGKSYFTKQKGTSGCNQVQDFENGKFLKYLSEPDTIIRLFIKWTQQEPVLEEKVM